MSSSLCRRLRLYRFSRNSSSWVRFPCLFLLTRCTPGRVIGFFSSIINILSYWYFNVLMSYPQQSCQTIFNKSRLHHHRVCGIVHHRCCWGNRPDSGTTPRHTSRRSSGVEHTLGKGGVECSIHSGGTILPKDGSPLWRYDVSLDMTQLTNGRTVCGYDMR